MKKINRIMAAIDFSLYSKAVLESAVTIAGRTKAEIVILNVVNIKKIESVKTAFSAERGDFSAEKFFADDIKRRGGKIYELIKKCVPEDISVRTVFRSGVPFEEIIKAVDEEKADFLVIGNKGKTNLSSVLFGTAVEKVFRHCPVPVLSLREKI